MKRHRCTEKRALYRHLSIGAKKGAEASAPSDLSPVEVTERCGVTDEEIELIEMRYQQALAILNLEDLFAEGQLDSPNLSPQTTDIPREIPR